MHLNIFCVTCIAEQPGCPILLHDKNLTVN